MNFFFIRLTTLLKLGISNSIAVIIYRLAIKFQLHPVCRISASPPLKPYFDVSRLHVLAKNQTPLSKSSITLFGHIQIPISDTNPKWLQNPITGLDVKLNIKPWWQIDDFDDRTGDIKIIWEQSRMNWVLAFSQRIRNGDKKSLIMLNDWIEDWLEINPPYLGINWK